jgi:hypothetical protein
MVKKAKNKREFSKGLAIMVSVAWLSSLIFSYLIWLFLDRFEPQLLMYTSVPFGTVVSTYLIKAGYENKQKIKQSSNEFKNEEGY